jgi:hypothetical protein
MTLRAYYANGRLFFGRNGELHVRVTPAYDGTRCAVPVTVS